MSEPVRLNFSIENIGQVDDQLSRLPVLAPPELREPFATAYTACASALRENLRFFAWAIKQETLHEQAGLPRSEKASLEYIRLAQKAHETTDDARLAYHRITVHIKRSGLKDDALRECLESALTLTARLPLSFLPSELNEIIKGAMGVREKMFSPKAGKSFLERMLEQAIFLQDAADSAIPPADVKLPPARRRSVQKVPRNRLGGLDSLKPLFSSLIAFIDAGKSLAYGRGITSRVERRQQAKEHLGRIKRARDRGLSQAANSLAASCPSLSELDPSADELLDALYTQCKDYLMAAGRVPDPTTWGHSTNEEQEIYVAQQQAATADMQQFEGQIERTRQKLWHIEQWLELQRHEQNGDATCNEANDQGVRPSSPMIPDAELSTEDARTQILAWLSISRISAIVCELGSQDCSDLHREESKYARLAGDPHIPERVRSQHEQSMRKATEARFKAEAEEGRLWRDALVALRRLRDLLAEYEPDLYLATKCLRLNLEDQAISIGEVKHDLSIIESRLNRVPIKSPVEETRSEEAESPKDSVEANPHVDGEPEAISGSKADGFFGAYGFRYGGKEVQFGKAALRRALVRSLWNSETNQPIAKPIENVMLEIWGDNHRTTDAAFRQLVASTNKYFQREACPLKIVYGCGQAEMVAQ